MLCFTLTFAFFRNLSPSPFIWSLFFLFFFRFSIYYRFSLTLFSLPFSTWKNSPLIIFVFKKFPVPYSRLHISLTTCKTLVIIILLNFPVPRSRLHKKTWKWSELGRKWYFKYHFFQILFPFAWIYISSLLCKFFSPFPSFFPFSLFFFAFSPFFFPFFLPLSLSFLSILLFCSPLLKKKVPHESFSFEKIPHSPFKIAHTTWKG